MPATPYPLIILHYTTTTKKQKKIFPGHHDGHDFTEVSQDVVRAFNTIVDIGHNGTNRVSRETTKGPSNNVHTNTQISTPCVTSLNMNSNT